MQDYKATRVMSLRIDPDLLQAVRERAAADGRSVSGQIVHYVRERIERQPEQPEKPKKLSGWLSHRDAPPNLEEFRVARREASRKLQTAANRRSRRK